MSNKVRDSNSHNLFGMSDDEFNDFNKNVIELCHLLLLSSMLSYISDSLKKIPEPLNVVEVKEKEGKKEV